MVKKVSAKTKAAVEKLEAELAVISRDQAKQKKQPIIRQEHEYDAIIDRRAEVLNDMVQAAMVFATDVQKEKLGQFEDKVQHDLETQENFASLELALLSELRIIEEAIVELKKMVTLNV